MSKHKFFVDVFPGQDRKNMVFFGEKDAIQLERLPGAKRVWIEVNIPDDSQLWPDAFTGEKATVTNVEVQYG